MNSTFEQQLRMQNGLESPPPCSYALGLLLYVQGVTNSGVQYIQEV
jgi:hypothetical protein